MKNKKILPYAICVALGLAVDYSLMNFGIDIPYSFMMLFSSLFIYELRYKYYPQNNTLFMKFIRFILLPVIAKFVIFK